MPMPRRPSKRSTARRSMGARCVSTKRRSGRAAVVEEAAAAGGLAAAATIVAAAAVGAVGDRRPHRAPNCTATAQRESGDHATLQRLSMVVRRNTEAMQRAAERRKREDEAARLHDEVPRLASLKLEIEERGGGGTGAGSNHIRHIVVDTAPALFLLPC